MRWCEMYVMSYDVSDTDVLALGGKERCHIFFLSFSRTLSLTFAWEEKTNLFLNEKTEENYLRLTSLNSDSL